MRYRKPYYYNGVAGEFYRRPKEEKTPRLVWRVLGVMFAVAGMFAILVLSACL